MPGPTEAKTRKELIDPALLRAGWNVDDPNQVGLEIPVDGFDPTAWQALQENLQRIRASGGVTYHLETPKGVSDYVLYRPNGEIIGVVEASARAPTPAWPRPRPSSTSPRSPNARASGRSRL